jgi:formate--tetrahydrofolate ligase
MLKPIEQVVREAGLLDDEIEVWGRGKAKVSLRALERLKDRPDGRLILVTGMSPTPAGEGKTVTAIGLAEAMTRLGVKAMLALRQPSLGPTLGAKGGGAGGGLARLEPFEDANLHFTGDFHAVAAAHNLLAACSDNAVFHGNRLGLERSTWPRSIDLCDRQLRHVQVGLGGKTSGWPRETGFVIAAASEIMAILALAESLEDLQERLRNIEVGWRADGSAVLAGDVGCVGAMLALLRDAIRPNLAQTAEGSPAFVHAGPFANIAHGCNSVLATRLALKLGDYAIVEAGFGADLGAEKFLNIKCRKAKLRPDGAALVVSCRALRYHGVEDESWTAPNLDALKRGLANPRVHLENLKKFGLPALVILNHFAGDPDDEIAAVRDFAQEQGVPFAVSDVATRGGAGGEEAARAVMALTAERPAGKMRHIYLLKWPLEKKIETLAREVYRADGVDYDDAARTTLEAIAKVESLAKLPICVAKTPLSLSDNPKRRGAPTGWRLKVRELFVNRGAGFIVVLTGPVVLMPGMPEHGAAERIDLDDSGNVVGLR